MSAQAVLPLLYCSSSLAHFILFHLEPNNIPHEVWNSYTNIALILNLCFAFFFVLVSIRGRLFTFMDSCGQTVVFGHLFVFALIWCVFGACCLLFLSSDITDASSLFWATSLFFITVSLSIMIYCISSGLACLCPPVINGSSPILYHLALLTAASFALTVAIFSDSNNNSPQNLPFSIWGGISTCTLGLLALILFKQSPSYALSFGKLRMKQILIALCQILALHGAFLLGTLLYNFPQAFQQNQSLILLQLSQAATLTPLFFETFIASMQLDQPSFSWFYPLRFLVKQQLSPITDGFTVQSVYALIFIMAQTQRGDEIAEVLTPWSTLFAPILMIYAGIHYYLRREVDQALVVSHELLAKVQFEHFLCEVGALTLWALWTVVWNYTGVFSDKVLSMCFSALFGIAMKNIFWFIFVKKILRNHQELSSDQLEPLTDESDDQQQLPPARPVEHLLDAVKVESDTDCAICLAPLRTEQAARVKSCGHRFHRECISHWLSVKRSCPLDRKALM